jgi:hypothetical protein
MDNKQDQNTEKLKEIPKWTRKYTQNRMLTPFVLLVMACLIGMVIAVPTFLIWMGFLRGNMILAGVGIALLIVVSIFYIMFFLKFCGKNRGLIDQIIDRRIYRKEGTASMSPPNITKKIRGLDYILGAIGLVYMLGVNHLCMMGFISFKYLQPLLALYLVPAFMVEYFLIMRTKIGPLFLICPILYAVHAILILAGVPIFFTGNLGVLNMVVPLFGYGFLAFAIGHIYSRYALKKLKGITHFQGDVADGA